MEVYRKVDGPLVTVGERGGGDLGSETNDGMNVFENNMKESDESALASLEHDSANRFE